MSDEQDTPASRPPNGIYRRTVYTQIIDGESQTLTAFEDVAGIAPSMFVVECLVGIPTPGGGMRQQPLQQTIEAATVEEAFTKLPEVIRSMVSELQSQRTKRIVVPPAGAAKIIELNKHRDGKQP